MLSSLVDYNSTFFDRGLTSFIDEFFHGERDIEEGPKFKEVVDGYEMEINLAGGKIEDVSVEVIGEKYLKVYYFNQTENSSVAYSLEEQMPEDADPKTVNASFKEGTLLVHVSKNKKVTD